MAEQNNTTNFKSSDRVDVDIKHFLFLLRSYWWLLLLATLVTAVAVYVSSRLIVPVYGASTTLFIDTRPDTTRPDLTEINTSERLASTYAEIIESRRIRNLVALKLDVYIEELGEFKAEQVAETQLISIYVENEDRFLVAEIANTVAEVFANEIIALQTSGFSTSKDNLENQLQYLENQITETDQALEALGNERTPSNTAERNRLDDLLVQYNKNYTDLLQSFEELRLAEIQSSSNIVILDPAIIPRFPIRPRVSLNTALGAIVGLILGVGIIFLIEFLDDTVKSPSIVERLTGMTVIASFGRMQRNENLPDNELITQHSPRSPSAEAFRDLRTALMFSAIDKPNGTIVVTSANPGEGKTTITANLAVVLAQASHRVLLIDCDLRRPRQQAVFNMPNSPGLTSLLLKFDPEADSEEFDHTLSLILKQVNIGTDRSNLHVLTSGPLPPNPSELLGSKKMTSLLALLSERFDYVLIDTPPALIVTDPLVMSIHADGVLIVTSAGKTRNNQIVDTVNRFREIKAPIMGIVLNNMSLRNGGYYYYKQQQTYYEYSSEAIEPPTLRNRAQNLLKKPGHLLRSLTKRTKKNSRSEIVTKSEEVTVMSDQVQTNMPDVQAEALPTSQSNSKPSLDFEDQLRLVPLLRTNSWQTVQNRESYDIDMVRPSQHLHELEQKANRLRKSQDALEKLITNHKEQNGELPINGQDKKKIEHEPAKIDQTQDIIDHPHSSTQDGQQMIGEQVLPNSQQNGMTPLQPNVSGQELLQSDPELGKTDEEVRNRKESSTAELQNIEKVQKIGELENELILLRQERETLKKVFTNFAQLMEKQ